MVHEYRVCVVANAINFAQSNTVEQSELVWGNGLLLGIVQTNFLAFCVTALSPTTFCALPMR
eukprot:3722152-Amphidinium_carterae.2